MDTEKTKSEELAKFWAQTQPAIAGFIHSLVPNFQDADDILQGVAVITVEKFDEYDRNKSFVAWANGIAKNLVLKYYSQKKNSNKQVVLDIETIQSIAQVYENDYKRLSMHKEDIELSLRKCMTLLRDKWKTILEMHYLRELSPTRIAQQLGMTPNHVFVLLHRGRLALRDCVVKELGQT